MRALQWKLCCTDCHSLAATCGHESRDEQAGVYERQWTRPGVWSRVKKRSRRTTAALPTGANQHCFIISHPRWVSYFAASRPWRTVKSLHPTGQLAQPPAPPPGACRCPWHRRTRWTARRTVKQRVKRTARKTPRSGRKRGATALWHSGRAFWTPSKCAC